MRTKANIVDQPVAVFRAGYEAFARDRKDPISDWQKAYFKLLEWKNTWRLPYKLELNAWSNNEPYVQIVIKAHLAEGVMELLDGLGYRWVEEEDVIGLVELEDYPDDMYDYIVE